MVPMKSGLIFKPMFSLVDALKDFKDLECILAYRNRAELIPTTAGKVLKIFAIVLALQNMLSQYGAKKATSIRWMCC